MRQFKGVINEGYLSDLVDGSIHHSPPDLATQVDANG